MNTHKSAIVALLGSPNVGKSSLINALLKEKVAAVSSKPQMTRNAVRCIYTIHDAQLVFVDTPGVHDPRHLLGDFMIQQIVQTLQEVDIVCFVVDAQKRGLTPQEEELITAVKELSIPVVLVVNKVDLIKESSEKIWQVIELFQDTLSPVAVVPISAMKDVNLDILLQQLIRIAPEGPAFYPEEMLMDSTERFLAAEIIREKIFTLTDQEVPHSVAVLIDEFKNPDEYPELKTARLRATIIVERTGQKGIIIGAKGQKLKEIGQAARLEMEERFGYPIFMELWVKVKPNWRKSQEELKRAGYLS